MNVLARAQRHERLDVKPVDQSVAVRVRLGRAEHLHHPSDLILRPQPITMRLFLRGRGDDEGDGDEEAAAAAAPQSGELSKEEMR